MFVGHLGASLAAKAAEPRLNLGAAFCAGLFADLLLWALVLAGIESVGPPQAAGPARFFTFVFPYSHSLAGNIVWSLVFAGVAWRRSPDAGASRTRVACLMGLVVLSHFVLDLIVHVPDLPIAGAASEKLGLGLWRRMPVALALECALTAAAFVWWLRRTSPPRARLAFVAGVVLVCAVLTSVGPYVPGDPPPAGGLAASSLVTLLAVVAAGFAAERRFSLVVERSRR